MRSIVYLEFPIKVIILAGGLGTRIMEETETKPKPMVLINGKPILWHVMSIYASQGFNDFVIATGYMHKVIDEWVEQLDEDWSVKSLYTGENTQTGGRIKRCVEHYKDDQYFITYGDGLANVNLKQLLSFHNHQGRIATVTAVRPPARFGVLEISNGAVQHFGEKVQTDAGWINGGFFVTQPEIVDYIESDFDLFETGALPKLSSEGQLSAFQHEGFWQPMDTLREKNLLDDFAQNGNPPWKLTFS
jgi:glucose-1-phosphate cytidylyltransferase